MAARCIVCGWGGIVRGRFDGFGMEWPEMAAAGRGAQCEY